MKIGFLGDLASQNSRAWLEGLRTQEDVEVVTWELPAAPGRYGRLRRGLALITALPRLRRWVARHKPDVLIAYRTTSYGFLGACLDVHPFVVAAQGETDVWPPDAWSAPIKAEMARFALRRADLIHAWAQHMTSSLVELGAPVGRIRVQPRGIDTTRFQPPLARTAAAPLVLVVTRALFPEYAHSVILQAFALVRARGLDARLDIAGDGPELTHLQSLAASLGIVDHVRFLGRVAHSDLPTLLREAEIYVSVPRTEGLSASLMEAMASGCFPIVTDLPANRALIEHDRSGLLVPIDGVDELAAAIMRARNEPTLRKQAAHHNLEWVHAHADARKNQAEFVDAYRDLIRRVR